MARAKFGYQLVSEDKTKEGIKSAQDGLKNLEGSMKSVNKIAATLMGAGAIAGVTMALRKLYQGASEAEKAFATLHPETQKAAGSLADWNRAMTELRAKGGEVVAGVMTPIRAAFLSLIDPIGSATRELSALNDQLAKISERYTSAGTKQFENMKAAQEALANAARVNKDAQAELNEVLKQQAMLAKQRPSTTLPDTLPEGMDPMQWLSIQEVKLAQWQESMAILDARAKKLAEAINQSAYQMKEIPKWIKEQTKGAGAGSAVAAAVAAFRGDYSVLQNADIAASMRGRMPEWAKGFGFGFGQTGKAPAGETDWFMEQRANALGAASAARNPVAAIDPLMQALGMLGGQFQSVAMIMQPLQVIFDSMMKVLTPIVDSLLSPIIGALVILGEALGKMLIPVIQILAPVIKVVSEAFVWLYNKVIRPFGNAIILIGNILYNAIASIYNWVSWLWGGTKMALRGLQEGFLEEISLGSLSTAGTQYQQSQAGGGNSASYTQARPITVNVVVNTDVITGEHGGFRELAIKMQNEIEAVLALGLA